MGAANAAVKIALLADASKAKKEIGDTEAKLSKFGKGMSALKGPALIAGAGFVALGKGLLDLAKGASEDDAAQKILAKTLKNTTGATDAQVASVEDYISKMGVATGITDDEMRPALAKLVAATKDVGKAQSLMGLAMDVSAGTGKDLGTVSAALAKAQNGSVGGLAKLGIATKDASGKTKTFAQIQKDLAKTFAGQSATAADSTAGKYKRFQLVMDELGETIGGGVLPVLGAIAGFMLTKVFPAAAKLSDLFEAKVVPTLQKFGEFIRSQVVPVVVELAKKLAASIVPAVKNLVAAFTPLAQDAGPKIVAVAKLLAKALGEVGSFLTGTVLPAIGKFTGFLRDNSTLVGAVAVGIGAMVLAFQAYQAVLLIVSVATKAYAAIQAALNVVMSLNPIAIVVLAIIGLAAALVYAYQKSETFRNIVDGAFGAVKTAVLAVIDFFKGLPGNIANAVGALGNLLKSKGIDLIVGFVTGYVGVWVTVIKFFLGLGATIAGKVGSLVSTIAGKGADLIKGFVSGYVNGWVTVATFFGGIGGKILGFIGNVGTLLYDAGAKLITGLADGLTSKLGAIKDAAGKVAGAIKGFFPGSPVKEGPLTSWNNGGAGKRLVGFLTDGLGDQLPDAKRAAASLAGAVQSGFGGVTLSPFDALSASQAASDAASAASGDTYVYVEIDGEQLQGRITKTVTDTNRDLKRKVKAG